MSAISRVNFEIAFEGSAQCWKNATVGAIDLKGTQSEISTESVGSGDSSLKVKRLKWIISNKDPLLSASNQADQIALTPELASKIQFSARVFESKTKGYDGVYRPEQRMRHDIPIDIVKYAQFEEGKCYLITIKVVDRHALKATFTKVDEEASKKSITASDLNALSMSELLPLFETISKKDREFKKQRSQAVLAGNMQELMKIVPEEFANAELLNKITKAMEKKAPKTEISQSVMDESKQRPHKQLHAVGDPCRVQ